MNTILFRGLRVRAVMAGVSLFSVAACLSRADAQSATVVNGRPIVDSPALRVLRYSPSDSGTAGSIITVTFDRPVTGMIGRDIDARRVMSIEPAIEGDFQWRDPSTLRFVPQQPFTPGTNIVVVIDTAAIASVGARTGAPYRFPVRIPSATPLMSWVEGAQPYEGRRIGPFPTFRTIYSAPIDLDSLSRIARVEFDPKCGSTIRLKPVRQRAIVKGEGGEFEQAGGYDRDTVADRFRRVVDLQPVDSMPPDCAGTWYVAPFDDKRPNDVWRYKIHTQPLFKISAVETCTEGRDMHGNPCVPQSIVIHFTTPAHSDSVARRVRVPAGFERNRAIHLPVGEMVYTGSVKPRDRYTVLVDNNLRDTYGRRLQGDTAFDLYVPDRKPGIRQQIGLTTIPRVAGKAPTMSVRTINVDTMLMTIIPVPDTLIPELLGGSASRAIDDQKRLLATARDTMRVKIPVRGAFNNETTVAIELPSAISAPQSSSIFSVRFSIASESLAPDSIEVQQARRKLESRDRRFLETRYAVLNGGLGYQYAIGALVQVTDIVAHSKLANDIGGAFVTDVNGDPLADATVTLIGPEWQKLSTGRSGRDGLAMLSRVSRARTVDARTTISRGSGAPRVRFLDVTHGGNRLIVPITTQLPRVTQNDISEFVSSAQRLGETLAHGTVTTDRDLYRPGEKLFAKAYVRYGVAGSMRVPAGDSIKFVFMRNYRDTVHTFVTLVNQFGTAVDSSQVPAGAPLGSYIMFARLLVDGVWESIGQASVRVAEFRAPEFLVSAESDTAWRYVGDTITARVEGKYLFGGPMAGMRVNWWAQSSPINGPGKSIPRTEGFAIGSTSWWDDRGYPESISMGSSDSLNKSGKLELRIPTQGGSLTRPSQLNISIAVVDANNQTVTASTSTPLQTSSFYIAVKTRSSGWYWKTGTSQQIEAFVVRSSGVRVTNVPLRVTILRRRLTQDSVGGFPSGARHWTADTLRRDTVTSALVNSIIAFTPETDGIYDIRFDAIDEKGRPASTNVGKWAYGYSWVPAPDNPKALRVTTQRATDEPFALGDTAQISFNSPFPRADAWITIEREGILEQRRLQVGNGTTTFPVRVISQFAPNMHVGVTLFRRELRGFNVADSLSQLIRSGSVNLVVDTTVHALRVVVAAQNSQYAPGDTARIRVAVSKKSSDTQSTPVESEVAVWAVDEGLASMSGYTTPNLVRLIDRQMDAAQTLASTLTMLPWSAALGYVLPGSGLDIGADGRAFFSGGASAGVAMSVQATSPPTFDGAVQLRRASASTADSSRSDAAGPSLRSVFRLTAFYVGKTKTDTDGIALIRAKLPDNITTYRLVATAISTGNLYGSGDATLLSTRSIVMRPSLPRFVRFGDSLWAAAVVNLRNRATATLQATATVVGATLRGNAQQKLSVTNRTSTMVRYPIAVPEKSSTDVLQMRFNAIENKTGLGDNVETTIPIRPQGTPRAHTVVGTIYDSASVSIDLPGEIDPALSTISLNLGSSPIVAMRTNYERLRDYPYRTTDHVVTLGRALLTLSRAERAIGSTLVTKDSTSVQADLQNAVDELSRRQTPMGNFLYWPNSSIALGGWMTAQAGTFLLEARTYGVNVSQSIFDGIERYTNGALAGYYETVDTVTGSPSQRRARLRANLGARVGILHYLRTATTPNVAREDSLIKRADVMAWEDRVVLADLMSRRPALATKAQALLDTAWTAITVAGNRMDFPDSLRGAAAFPSHVRPAARLLVTTMRLSPAHPLIGALSETIIQQGRAESGWAWNSQDYGASVEALGTLVAAQRATGLADIVVRDASGKTVISRSISSAATQAPDSARPLNSLAQTIDGKSRVSFSLRVEAAGSAQRAPRTAPLYFSATINEMTRARPVTPDIGGIVVERWYEKLGDGTPVVEVNEGDVVRVRLRITVPSDRQFVAVEDLLPAGLEPIDLAMRTSSTLGPFANSKEPQQNALTRMQWDGPLLQSLFFGSWDGGYWSPWEYKELRDDRVLYFARQLWTGTYNASYAARATTAGKFVRPPAHAEEIYNRALNGRSDGGVFVVNRRPE